MVDRTVRQRVGRTVGRIDHQADPLAGLAVFERGWLSSNNLLIHAAAGEPGATLVDTGHLNHAGQTVALVEHALAGRPLARLVNTHLHSDHCGGNAALARRFAATVTVAESQTATVQGWDESRLSYGATGQRMERYDAHHGLAPGETLVAGGRAWEVLHAPGHDPDSLMLFDRRAGLLVSADALWEHGFGIVFPEVAGEPGFDDVAEALERIAALPVRLVLPGHGRPFDDVAGALARARARLQGFREAPARHAQHAAKVLIKYHMMECGACSEPELLAWAAATPLLRGIWQRHAPDDALSPADWARMLADGLLAQGALRRLDDGRLADA